MSSAAAAAAAVGVAGTPAAAWLGARPAPRRRRRRSRVSSPTTVAAADNHDDDGAREAGVACSRRRALLAPALLWAAAGAAGLHEERAAEAAAFCGVGSVNGAVPSWAFTTPWREDLVDFQKGAKTWTRVIGDEKRAKKAGHLPLLVLHGGPGFGSAYLESLELLTSQDRQIAFYDQFGCGYSQLGSSALAPISIPLLLEELASVRKSLGLKEMHLLGHGTGGMLALEYLLSTGAKDAGVASLTLVSTPPSYARLVDDRRARLDALASDTRDTLLAGDERGLGGFTVAPDAAYRQAFSEYEREFVCRSRPVTDDCVREAAAPTSVASELCGSRTFTAAGKLAGWDLTDRLHQITTPTLVACGDSDELLPGTSRALHSSIPGSSLHVFDGSGSFVHIDAWEPLLETVDAFVKANDPVVMNKKDKKR